MTTPKTHGVSVMPVMPRARASATTQSKQKACRADPLIARSPKRAATLSVAGTQVHSDEEVDELAHYSKPISVSKIDRLGGTPPVLRDHRLRGSEHWVVPMFFSLEHVRLGLPEPIRPMNIALFGGGAALDAYGYKAPPQCI